MDRDLAPVHDGANRVLPTAGVAVLWLECTGVRRAAAAVRLDERDRDAGDGRCPGMARVAFRLSARPGLVRGVGVDPEFSRDSSRNPLDEWTYVHPRHALRRLRRLRVCGRAPNRVRCLYLARTTQQRGAAVVAGRVSADRKS